MALAQNTTNYLAAAISDPAAFDEVRDILEANQALSATEAGYLDGVTAGTAAASKAVVLDGSKGIATITSATITTLTNTTANVSGNATISGTLTQGSDTTDRVAVKGIYYSPAVVSVTVPSITDPDIARVQVDVSGAFSMQPAVGDAVIAIPAEALPTNCRLQGAFVYQTDGVEICFGSEGGNVTGGAKNFRFLVIDVT